MEKSFTMEQLKMKVFSLENCRIREKEAVWFP